ncbi:MAG: tyrosine-type recombinase/integrase [Pseudomonadota bacterium]
MSEITTTDKNALPGEAYKALTTEVLRARLWERWVTWRSARSSNTIRAVIYDVKVFTEWGRATGHRFLPASPEAVSLFLQAEASKGLSVATIERRASSISTLHRLAEQRNPCEDALVAWRISAIRRSKGKAQNQAYPLRIKGDVENLETSEPEGLSLIGILKFLDDEVLQANELEDPLEKNRLQRHALRDSALFCVAYDAGLRSSETVRVQIDHITAAPGKGGELFLPTTKTDGEGEGSFRFLSERTLKRLKDWVSLAGIEEGPIFLGMKRSGALNQKAIASDTVGRIFKKRVEQYFKRQKEDPLIPLTTDEMAIIKGVSGHSGRVGVCQDAFAAGEDIGGIMRDFDWKTARMPIMYARKLSVRSGAAARLHNKTQ